MINAPCNILRSLLLLFFSLNCVINCQNECELYIHLFSTSCHVTGLNGSFSFVHLSLDSYQSLSCFKQQWQGGYRHKSPYCVVSQLMFWLLLCFRFCHVLFLIFMFPGSCHVFHLPLSFTLVTCFCSQLHLVTNHLPRVYSFQVLSQSLRIPH